MSENRQGIGGSYLYEAFHRNVQGWVTEREMKQLTPIDEALHLPPWHKIHKQCAGPIKLFVFLSRVRQPITPRSIRAMTRVGGQ
ncbi:hypothetical protein TNCV_2426531 [Trichonephila clavipes]|nr:hypothetical protein TNCV_2426531 [Trichonephila clavipes]